MIRGLGTNISHSSKLSGLPAQMAIEGGWKMARSIKDFRKIDMKVVI